MQSDVSQWTIMTYPGVSAVVIMLIGGLKKLFPAWIDKKEPVLGLAFSVILGVLAKLTVPGAFEGVQWVPHFVGLIMAAFGAKLGHDYLLNEVVGKKKE